MYAVIFIIYFFSILGIFSLIYFIKKSLYQSLYTYNEFYIISVTEHNCHLLEQTLRKISFLADDACVSPKIIIYCKDFYCDKSGCHQSVKSMIDICKAAVTQFDNCIVCNRDQLYGILEQSQTDIYHGDINEPKIR